MDVTQVERWMAIPDHPGYEVSDLGRVRSLDRMIEDRNGKRYRRRGKLLRLWPEHGYLMVRLGTGRQWGVHRLVLFAFVGPTPEGMQALHENGDRSDARLVNLRWGTPVENMADKLRHGMCSQATKRLCPRGHELFGLNLNPAHDKVGTRQCRACTKALARINWCKLNGFVAPDYQEESDRQYANVLAGRLDGRAGRKITKWLPMDQQPKRAAS